MLLNDNWYVSDFIMDISIALCLWFARQILELAVVAPMYKAWIVQMWNFLIHTIDALQQLSKMNSSVEPKKGIIWTANMNCIFCLRMTSPVAEDWNPRSLLLMDVALGLLAGCNTLQPLPSWVTGPCDTVHGMLDAFESFRVNAVDSQSHPIISSYMILQ